MKELVVYGGRIHLNGKSTRAIVATRTKKKAMELVGVGVSGFKNYWSETRNEYELEIALAEPEMLFVCTSGGWTDNPVYEKGLING